MLLKAEDSIAKDIEVLNLENGEYIRGCAWANEETGEYAIYNYDLNGHYVISYDEPDLTILKGNIAFVYIGN